MMKPERILSPGESLQQNARKVCQPLFAQKAEAKGIRLISALTPPNLFKVAVLEAYHTL